MLVLPFPAQGHVNPMMSFSQKLVEQGCNIIFVNTDFNHERVVRTMLNQESLNGSPIKLASIPDGLGPEDDRNDFGELCVAMLSTMPAMLEKLIEDIHLNGDIRISSIVADVFMGWALEVASKLGINGVLFWPASAAIFVLQYNIPKLIDDGIIRSDDGNMILHFTDLICLFGSIFFINLRSLRKHTDRTPLVKQVYVRRTNREVGQRAQLRNEQLRLN